MGYEFVSDEPRGPNFCRRYRGKPDIPGHPATRNNLRIIDRTCYQISNRILPRDRQFPLRGFWRLGHQSDNFLVDHLIEIPVKGPYRAKIFRGMQGDDFIRAIRL